MSLQSLMKQDFGDDDSDSPDEDFDPIGDADSGDEDDLPATIEAQYAQNLSQLCSDGDEELLAKLLAEMTQTPSENKAVSAEGDAPAAGIDAEPDLNIDHLNQDGCTALFTAICHQQLGCCKQLLVAGAKTNVLHEGSSYLHAAMVLSSHAENRAFSLSLAKILLARGASVTVCDGDGRTCLHAAVLGGFLPCIRLILSQKDCPSILNAKDDDGNTVLHLACASHMAAEIVDLLLNLAPDVKAVNKRLQLPLHIANQYRLAPKYLSKLGANGTLDEAQDCMGHKPEEVPRIPEDQLTLLVYHEICKKHATPSTNRGRLALPPENYHRVEALVNERDGILRGSGFAKALEWKTDPDPASMSDILRVHDYPYVARVQNICKSLEGTSRMFMLDEDTALNKDSFAAAATAAGAVVTATRRVCGPKLEGERACRNAICVVRPPGHHAGPRGQVLCHEGADTDPLHKEGWGSHGFCLLNNVAIGAAHARCVLRKSITKVALVDFDVHHGNGTEAIVRNLVPSTYSTDLSLPFGTAKVTSPCYKPWKDHTDADDVFFVSVHGFGQKDDGPFYPGTGRTATANNVWNFGMGKCCREQWRSKWRLEVLPALHKFNPDVIFISAGFDAHKTDKYNHGFISLVSSDYKWVTRMLVSVANSCCDGRIVSVLEGGYNVAGKFASPFAKSVAAHVDALCRTSPDLKWTPEQMQREEKFETDEPARIEVCSCQWGTHAAARYGSLILNNTMAHRLLPLRNPPSAVMDKQGWKIALAILEINITDVVEAIEDNTTNTPVLKRSRRTRKKVDYRKLMEEENARREAKKAAAVTAATESTGQNDDDDDDDDDDDYGGSNSDDSFNDR